MGLFQGLFVPSDTSLGFISSSFQDFKEVFPFKLFFGLRDIVDTSIADFNGSGSSLAFVAVFPGYASSSIPLLNPTTLSTHGFGATMLNWWYNIILMGAMVMLAGGVWKLITHK